MSLAVCFLAAPQSATLLCAALAAAGAPVQEQYKRERNRWLRITFHVGSKKKPVGSAPCSSIVCPSVTSCDLAACCTKFISPLLRLLKRTHLDVTCPHVGPGD